jgi:hypothetical protein
VEAGYLRLVDRRHVTAHAHAHLVQQLHQVLAFYAEVFRDLIDPKIAQRATS